MSILKNLNTGQLSVLRPLHVIGRETEHVHTHIKDSDISEQHAHILWQDGHWVLNDVSKNGVWLNNERVKNSSDIPLSLNDHIRFGYHSHNNWQLISVERPTSCLIAIDHQREPIRLGAHNTSHELDYELIDKDYCFINLSGQYNEYQQGQKLHYDGHDWQLLLVEDDQAPTTARSELPSSQAIRWLFHSSFSEESITLNGELENGETISFDKYDHHYILLVLARKRVRDAEDGYSEPNQGWVDAKRLPKMLGLTEAHMNIHIFRARKQLQRLLSCASESLDFIERRPGQMRFKFRQFTIYRGTSLEAQLKHTTNHSLASAL